MVFLIFFIFSLALVLVQASELNVIEFTIKDDGNVGVKESEEAGLFTLESVENYKAFPLDYDTYQKWSTLDREKKLGFVLDRFYLMGLRDDFTSMKNSFKNADVELDFVIPDSKLHFLELLTALKDFQDIDKIEIFYRRCDSNTDNLLSFQEYVVCRLEFDRNGNAHDQSEFDSLENIIISDFERQLRDPDNPMVLELIKLGKF